MVFTYKDKQLNELNQGKNVYSSNPEYAKRKGYKIVTPSPKNKGETNTIISDGQEFRVVATKTDRSKSTFSYYSVIYSNLIV